MSADAYTTLRAFGSAELIERKSRFLGYAMPVKTEEEALSFLQKIRSEHRDAKHNVYAYQIANGNLMRYSDDGEPQGTAGLPVLDVIRKNAFTDAILVVTRYFGGILLGTGGLVRAYSAAAKAAVQAAQIVTYVPYSVCKLCCSYAEYPRLESDLARLSVRIDQVDYAEEISLTLAMPSVQYNPFCDHIKEITGGKRLPVLLGTRYDA